MRGRGHRKLVTSQSEEDPTKEGEYVIEKILQKRVRNGVVSAQKNLIYAQYINNYCFCKY